MPINPGYITTIPQGTRLFRITPPTFNTTNTSDHIKVVNGQGAVNNSAGARYNYPGVCTVYLTEDLESCFAERMFYFHREVLRGLDELQLYPLVIPPLQRNSILWEIQFDHDLTDLFDACISTAPNYFNIIPSLMVNPSQDYAHLKQKRAEIQSNGYQGMRVPSSRATINGNLIILFNDQSTHVENITPHEVEFRLITQNGRPFINHTTELLDFTSGEVRMPYTRPSGTHTYQNWQKVNFNH
jgi:RES domain-containing protein